MASGATQIDSVEIERYFSGDTPAWDAVDFDLHCSRCGYNLRMLSRPKCTECGLEFEWRELVVRQLSINPKLFEHGWRRNPVRSYLSSVLLPIVSPRRFWKCVSLHDSVKTGPLVFLILTAPLLVTPLLMGLAAVCALLIDRIWGFNTANRLTLAYYWPNSNLLECFFAAVSNAFWKMAKAQGDLAIMYAIFMPITVCGRMLVLWLLTGLSDTIARCRLRRAHMLRVVGYSSGAAYCAIAIGAVTLLMLQDFSTKGLGLGYEHRWIMQIIAMSVAIMILTWVLRPGFRIYLGIPQATLVAFMMAVVEVFTLQAIAIVISASL